MKILLAIVTTAIACLLLASTADARISLSRAHTRALRATNYACDHRPPPDGAAFRCAREGGGGPQVRPCKLETRRRAICYAAYAQHARRKLLICTGIFVFREVAHRARMYRPDWNCGYIHSSAARAAGLFVNLRRARARALRVTRRRCRTHAGPGGVPVYCMEIASPSPYHPHVARCERAGIFNTRALCWASYYQVERRGNRVNLCTGTFEFEAIPLSGDRMHRPHWGCGWVDGSG